MAHEPAASPEKEQGKAPLLSLRDKPGVKLFIGGFLGTIPYAFLRGHAQQKAKELESTDPAIRKQAKESFPMRFREWSQTNLGMDKPTAQTYTEFGYSFFGFLAGLFYIKPLLDHFFPDTPKPGSKPEPKIDRNIVESVGHNIRQTNQFLFRIPIASALALIPYSFAGWVLEKTLFAKRTDEHGVEKERTGLDATINTPFNKLELKIGLMFSTFNIAYHYTNKLLDKLIGPRKPKHTEKHEEQHDEAATLKNAKDNTPDTKDITEKHEHAPPKATNPEKPGLIRRVFTEARDVVSGIILPVMTAVTPLVTCFYFSNRGTFGKQLAAKPTEDRNLIDHTQEALFKVGDAARTASEKLIKPLIPDTLATNLGLDEQGKAHAAHAVLYMSTAYGAYAFARQHTNGIFKNLLGHSSLTEAKAAAPATPTLPDAQLAAQSKDCGCTAKAQLSSA